MLDHPVHYFLFKNFCDPKTVKLTRAFRMKDQRTSHHVLPAFWNLALKKSISTSKFFMYRVPQKEQFCDFFSNFLTFIKITYAINRLRALLDLEKFFPDPVLTFFRFNT
jgi:hypothetical protein